MYNMKELTKFEVVNASEKDTTEIYLYGQIVNESWGGEYGISEKDIVKALKDIPKNVKQINLRINSPGGSVFSGTTIYELLKKHPAKVVAYVEGMAASIASIIAMAADEIVMGDAALFMIHKPLVGVYGNANELRDMIDILDKIEYQMIGIYKKRMTASREEIENYLTKETYFTAEQAIEAGLADRVADSSDESRYLTACIVNDMRGSKMYKALPSMQSPEELESAKRREEIQALTKDIFC